VFFKSEDGRQLIAKVLFEEDATFRKIIGGMCDYYTIFGLKGNLLYISPIRHQLLGMIPADSEGMLDRVHSEHKVGLLKSFLKIVNNNKSLTIEYRISGIANEWIWVESTGIPVTDRSGKVEYVVFLTKNITARKGYEEKLVDMAFHDPLTELPNRFLFNEHVIQSLAQAKRNQHALAILYIDIDKFKQINDSMGHDVGDELLKVFSDRVKSCLRESDMMARIGGDEFMVLLPTIDSLEGVILVIDRIFAATRAIWTVGNHSFHSTISVGISMYPSNSDDATTLIKQSDIALYQVKNAGRNNYQFFSSDNISPEQVQR
jgi:diguanylate cyclase (GGDEF)-like protein/PAS domain S-box-containing protein